MKIPSKFHNSLEEQPFSHCHICDKSLLEDDQEYLIEKAYRKFPNGHGEELLFEIAICIDCAMKMRTTLSKESLENIERFVLSKGLENQQHPERRERLMEDPLQQCLLSGKPLEQVEQYQIYAHCQGDHIAQNGGFYMLSDDILEEMQGLLSKQTRDELNRFSNDNFGIPPELRKLFGSGDLITL